MNPNNSIKRQQVKRHIEDEHFVPQFVLNNFADSKGLICVTDLLSSPVRMFETKSSKVCFAKNLYESTNIDGTYFERNTIENKYAKMESFFATEIKCMIEQLKNKVKLNENNQVILCSFIALQLVRTPRVKKFLVANNSNINENDKALYINALYRMMIDSIDSGIGYLNNNGFVLSETATEDIKSKKSLFDEIASFLVSNCIAYFIRADESEFCVADEPILIDKFEDVKYLYPISPKYAIACSLFDNTPQNAYNTFYNISRDGVKKINSFSVRNAERFVVCSHNEISEITGLKET